MVRRLDGSHVDHHLLAPLIALAVSRETFKSTFKADGTVDEDVLYGMGVDEARVPRTEIRMLKAYSDAFEQIHEAWQALSGYTEPPCPVLARVEDIIRFTATFPLGSSPNARPSSVGTTPVGSTSHGH